MNKTQVMTLRVPAELKERLEIEAKLQKVSMNYLAGYLLTTQLSQLEVLSAIETRLSKTNLATLKGNVLSILDSVQKTDNLPKWDKI